MSVFIMFVEKYFDLLIYKPVGVSIVKKTGFDMLKFSVDQLVWVANLVKSLRQKLQTWLSLYARIFLLKS